MKFLPCDSCLCLPVCSNEVLMTRDKASLFGYFMNVISLERKCSIFYNFLHPDTQWYDNFQNTKVFFLRQKGLL